MNDFMTPETLKAMPIEQRFRLFVQWLGNQPVRGRYVYDSVRDCAMCQFAHTLEAGKWVRLISAGSDYIDFRFRSPDFDRGMEIELLPHDRGGYFALHTNVFGKAYDLLAREAGLPRRAKRRAVLCRWLAFFAKKQKHPLAA